MTGKTIWKTCYVHGSKTLAKRVHQQKFIEWERKKHLKLEAKKEYTFGELLKWYLDHPKAKRKKTYLRDVEVSKILGKQFGSQPAREIKPTDIETFQDIMLKTPSRRKTLYKPATVNRFVTLIKTVYNLAIRDDMVEKNPCWKVPFLPERNVRDRIVSPEEFEMLKGELPQYALILSLGYYLGMREGEILNLKEKQIHFHGNGADEGFIELYDGETKTGEGREVPFGNAIGRLLKGHLISRKKCGPERYLFTTENGNLLGNFRRAFQRACKRAGIKGLCFHDFRHTAITNMRKAGVNISVIMAISGHKTMAMFKRYNKIDLNDGREAMRSLETYLSGMKGQEKRIETTKENELDYCNITAKLRDGTIASA
jgi:integrase